MKPIQYAILLLSAAAAGGCASMQDGLVDHEVRLRNRMRAQHAWNEWSWCYDDLDHPFHFAKGFKAGYRDILNGGKGCQPTLPPRCYWKSCYRSAEGRCKVNAWFDGFSHGALAAQQDGVGAWNQIPLSPTARMNMHAVTRSGQPMPTAHPLPPPVAPVPPEIPEPDSDPTRSPEPPPLPDETDQNADGGGNASDDAGVAIPLPYE